MSTFKQCISLLLALCLALSVVPVTAHAATACGTCGDNLTWTLNDDGVLSISGEGPMDDYFNIVGYNYSDPPWYSSGNAVKTISISDGVTHIGTRAFYNCKNLTSVNIPDSVVSIGSGVFLFCHKLPCITIPDSVKSIGGGLFDYCYQLKSAGPIGGGYDIEFGWTEAIPDFAFSGCEYLTHITLPDSITSIGDRAFYECKKLTSVVLPDGVTTIGGHAFYYCNNLTNLVIPDSVVSIGSYAFDRCWSLKTIKVPPNLTCIENGVYSYCSGLSSITIPDNVREIGVSAFGDCTGLKKVVVGSSVELISWGAFSGCKNLNEIVFQGDAPTFEEGGVYADPVFLGVKATAYYPADNPTWTADVMQNYGGNITWKPINVEITTSIHNYSADDLILIYPVDPESILNLWTTLSDVTVSSTLGESVPPKGGFFIHRADASAQEMILSKDGYRDYILPAEVTRTMRGKKGVAYTLTAHMQKDQKDGKPYISTVFGRESSLEKTYTDLWSNPLVVKENTGCDVIVTAVGFGELDVTYYLAQDSKRKVSSSTGVFTNELLYTVFDDTSTVYAYAVGSDGRMTEPLAIKINREAEFDLEKELGLDSEISLLGKDFFKIKISDDIPVLGGMELDMSAFTVPVGVSVVGDEIKISLGVDLFSSTDSDEGYKWKTFKDMVVTDDDIDLKKIETFCNVYDLAQGHSWKKTNTTNKFNVNVLGFVEGKWINGEFVIKEGEINLGGNFKFQYNAQGAVWVVPVYGSVETGADFSVGGKVNRFLPDRDIPFEFTMLLDVTPKLAGKAGAGIKGAASAGLYAEGKLPLMIAFQEEHFTLDVDGEIGVEGELFLLHGKKALLEGDTNLIDWYYGTSDSPSAESRVPEQNQTTTMVVSRDYAENTSAWLGDRGPALSIHSVGTKTVAARGITFRELQNSIFSNSQPQLVTVGDQMLLVWVQDDASRDTYNRMRLVYSVYDPMGDSWSEPQPVWDDGHNDGYPKLVSDGSQAYVLWQKVNTTLTAENTTDIDATIENSELCLARFDVDTGVFDDAQLLTDNDLYEYAHNVVVENGEPAVYWAVAEGNAMNTSGSNALYRWLDGIVSVLAQNLNYVLSIDACDGDVTYVADIDGDLSSTEDVTVTTISDSGTEVFDNSELGSAVMYAGYAPLDGESVLLLSDMRNIYYNYNGEVKSVLEESRTIDGNLNIVETDQGTTIIWTETVDGWNEIYAVRYENGEWSAPVMISESGKLLTKINATGYDGKLFGVCNANAVTYDEASGEYVTGETDMILFQTDDFSDIALANYMNINENTLEAGVETSFNVTVYNNGINFVDEVTFTVTDTLGTESVQTVAVAIPSGSSETVMLTYLVPDGYTTTTMTVTADIANDDVKEPDNILSRKIGNPDLAVTETAVEVLSDGYKITAIVENGSLVNAENVTLSVFADEECTELLRSKTIGAISRENYALGEILVKEDALYYAENGTAKFYLKLAAGGDDASAADNILCVVVSEAAKTVCMHPVTELVASLEPTCTEPGYETHEICAACGEAIGEITAIPARGHSYTSLVTQPTCTEQGYTTYTCFCGASYIDDYVDAMGHEWIDLVCANCGALEYPVLELETDLVIACAGNDYTYVVFTPNVSGNYMFYSVNSGNTKGALFTSNMERLAYNDDCCYGHNFHNSFSFCIEQALEAGQTYILGGCFYSGAAGYISVRVDHVHDYKSTITKEATCTEDGETTYICTFCGDTYTVSIPGGHNYGGDGICVNCGETYVYPILELETDLVISCSGSNYTFVKFTPVEDGCYVFYSVNSGDTTAALYNMDLTELEYNDDCSQGHDFHGSYSFCITQNLEGGQTYILGTRFYSGKTDDMTIRVDHANTFTDVASGTFYYDPVMWAIENGITNGTSATTFGPNDQCMRAHVVTFLWRAVGCPEPTRTDNPFVDVPENAFYYKPVLWALENGITSGMDATHFGPTAYCNRAQVVTFLYRTMDSPELESAENPFTDVAKGSFYEKPVLWAVQNGITNGLSTTAFGPNAICNRAQIVTFLYRAFVD